MTTRVGRSVISSGVRIPGVTTGSAYSAYDAMGSAFEIPYAVGQEGGLVGQINAIDLSTGLPQMRLHIFKSALNVPSTDGTPWTCDVSDFNNYCGYVEIAASDWVSASGRMLANVHSRNPVIQSIMGTRSVYAQAQVVNAPTFGNVTGGGMYVALGVLQD